MGNHDVYYKEPLCNFEMHRGLFGSTHEGKFYEYYSGVKDCLIKDDWNNYGYHFSPEDFYVYITSHEYKHYSVGGTGLRSLLDIYVFLRKFEGKLNFDYVLREIEKLELSEFEEKNRTLVKSFRGARTSRRKSGNAQIYCSFRSLRKFREQREKSFEEVRRRNAGKNKISDSKNFPRARENQEYIPFFK